MSDLDERLLEERFSALRRETTADWKAIERQARRSVRRAALVSVSLLLAVAVSAPALGWHRTVLDWLDTEEASSEVKLEFARLGIGAPAEHKLGIEHEQARTVTTVKHGGKSYVLSVAPTSSGGFCFWWADLTASCRQARTSPPAHRERGSRDLATFRLGTIWMPDAHGVMQSIAGNLIGDDIEQLSAVHADGSRETIPVVWVSEPIDAGFYLYFVPEEHRVAGKHLTELAATDADGDPVARQTFALTPPSELERPVELPDGMTTSLPAKAIVSKATKVVDFTASDGSRVTLWEMPTTEGGVCYVSRRSSGCPRRPLDVPLAAGILGGSVPVLYSGQVRTDVAKVMLRFQDGTEMQLEPTKGYVLVEIPPRNYERGHRLMESLALDAAGNVLARYPFDPSQGGSYPCDKPVDQGFGVKMCP